MDISPADIIGSLGIGCYLLSYTMLQWRREFAKTLAYSVINFMAAALLGISLWYNFNLPALIGQVLWVILSIYGIYRCLKYKKMTSKKT